MLAENVPEDPPIPPPRVCLRYPTSPSGARVAVARRRLRARLSPGMNHVLISALKKTLRLQQIYFDEWEPGWKNWGLLVPGGARGSFPAGVPVRVPRSPRSAWTGAGRAAGLDASFLGDAFPASSPWCCRSLPGS